MMEKMYRQKIVGGLVVALVLARGVCADTPAAHQMRSFCVATFLGGVASAFSGLGGAVAATTLAGKQQAACSIVGSLFQLASDMKRASDAKKRARQEAQEQAAYAAKMALIEQQLQAAREALAMEYDLQARSMGYLGGWSARSGHGFLAALRQQALREVELLHKSPVTRSGQENPITGVPGSELGSFLQATLPTEELDFMLNQQISMMMELLEELLAELFAEPEVVLAVQENCGLQEVGA